ncbi:MAG TPA: C39 family peptidase [Chitinispirillaceae bacterium]|nr:C39 family peptidase [Chitinispirillaceae bacterium]
MSTILVRPVELRQTAEQLRSRAKRLTQALEAIDNTILSLKGDKFLGHRADAVQAHYAPKRAALLKAKEMVLHFSQDLEQAATSFERADKQNTPTPAPGPAPTPAPGNKLPSIKQIALDMGDPRWKKRYMNNKTGEDINHYGCLLTVLAMLCRANGVDMNPARIDAWNDKHGGYQSGSNMTYAAQIEFLSETLGRDINRSEIYTRNSTQHGLPNIRKQLDSGVPVVLHIDSKSNPTDGHFVLAVGIDAKGNYICADPTGGKQVTVSAKNVRDARIYN